MNDPRQHVIRNGDTAHGKRDPATIARFAGVTVQVMQLEAGDVYRAKTDSETAWLLMQGRIRGQAESARFELARHSLFDESASCLHASAGTEVSLEAVEDSELTVYRCGNGKSFGPRVFEPAQVPNEHRGEGQVAGRCLRFVRTIFDDRNSPENAELVLGEVVTLPGGWSSYPPHHHRQPEIYHYRFTEPQGYGHAELGDDVFKVNDRDTICIPPGLDHAQCAAPGYGMYYSWVIRHLPGDRYTVPEFTDAHAWTMKKDAPYWWPADVPQK